MSKREDALDIVKSLGLPKQQQNERSALTLLALAGLKEADIWTQVSRPLLRIWDIMGWMREHYGKDYAANSRETIRRQTIRRDILSRQGRESVDGRHSATLLDAQLPSSFRLDLLEKLPLRVLAVEFDELAAVELI